jgi:hypothetical protein
MPKYDKTIAIDIDGVLADFEGEFCDKFGTANRELANLHKRYPKVDPDLIDEFINSPNSYKDLAPIFGGILLVNQARMKGWYILLLTSRPEYLAEVTKVWLEGYDIQYNDLWFTQDKAESISKYNRLYPGRHIWCQIDDIVTNLTKNPIGVAWEQPWNQNYYPRARYNEITMEIDLNLTQYQRINFWENVNEK